MTFFLNSPAQGYELVGQFRPLKSELSTKSRTRQTGNDLELAQPTKNIITLFVITQIIDIPPAHNPALNGPSVPFPRSVAV